jgi:divalent metal cation (Fe/Co/Zn/Cd) transporter
MAIFMSGAIFSFYEGFRTFSETSPLRMAWVNYAVLLGAAALETMSLVQGVRQARAGAARRQTSLSSHIRDPDDPTVKSVVLEDTAALVGLALAGVGVTLRELTGDATYDGAASIAIGLLLIATSIAIARTCKSLLVGQQADVALVRAIKRFFESDDDVLEVVDLLTMMVGVERVLLCARVDFVTELSADELEEACVRIDEELRAQFPMLGEIFVEPVPRSDQRLRDRVLSRYGVAMSGESAGRVD